MQRVAINKCFGGFGLSRSAMHRLRVLGQITAVNETDIGEEWPGLSGTTRSPNLDSFCSEIKRDDPLLIQVLEEMGDEASAEMAEVRVVGIPDGVKWTIHYYDGLEHVEEAHETWG